MGHYRSEMGYEEEDKQRAVYEKNRRKERANKIKQLIKEEGLEYVLADIVADPLVMKVST